MVTYEMIYIYATTPPACTFGIVWAYHSKAHSLLVGEPVTDRKLGQ